MTRPDPDPWQSVSAARLPAAALDALGPVRDRPDVRVSVAGGVAWVRWPPPRADVVRCLLPVPGAEFFTRRSERWFRFGSRVPTADAPPAEDRPLASVLFPDRLAPTNPPADFAPPVVLRVVRGGDPQPATALACALADLAVWADSATTAELAAVRAARDGSRALLLGAKLPAVASGVRFWGTDVLVPVGFRPDPDLPPPLLREAAGVGAGELLLLAEDGAEGVPESAFEPVTRAGLRRALLQ
jgi:hypothetical protein